MKESLKKQLKALKTQSKLSNKAFFRVWSDIFMGDINSWYNFPPDEYILRELENMKTLQLNLIQYEEKLMSDSYDEDMDRRYEEKYNNRHKPSDYLVEWGLDECGKELFVSASSARQLAYEEGIC